MTRRSRSRPISISYNYYPDDEHEQVSNSNSPYSYSDCDSIDEVFARFRVFHRRVRDAVSSLNDLDDTVINQGTLDAMQPQLAFHSVHGANVELRQGDRVARRKESFCKGLAFSNRPIAVNENVCIRLSEVASNWSGVLRFGVMNVDPEYFRTAGVPKFACPDMTSKKGAWAKALPERYCTEGNLLHFYIAESGDLMYGVNGVQKGVFLSGVNTNLPMWTLVDIYGNTTAVEFIDTSEFRGNRSRAASAAPRIPSSVVISRSEEHQPDVIDQTSYQRPFDSSHSSSMRVPIPATIANAGNLETVRFHRVVGSRMSLNADRSIAFRVPEEYTQGYCFTERPIKMNEKVYVQIVNVQHLYGGGLAFGVTCADPSKLRVADLPDDSADVIELPDYWVGIKDIALQPSKNTVLAFYITDSGEVRFERNSSGERTVMFVDNTLPLYMWFDCYGSTQSIKLLGYTREDPSRPLIPQPGSSSSRNRSTPLRVDLRSSSTRTSSDSAAPSAGGTARVPALPPRNRSTVLDEIFGPIQSAPPLPAIPPPPPPRPTVLEPTPAPVILPAPPSRRPPQIPPMPSASSAPSLSRSALTSSPSATTHSSPSPGVGPSFVSSFLPNPLAPGPIPQRSTSVTSEKQGSPEDLDANEECTICMSAAINCVLYNCGHMSMCFSCAQQTMKTSGLCPICRSAIKDVIRTYRS